MQLTHARQLACCGWPSDGHYAHILRLKEVRLFCFVMLIMLIAFSFFLFLSPFASHNVRSQILIRLKLISIAFCSPRTHSINRHRFLLTTSCDTGHVVATSREEIECHRPFISLCEGTVYLYDLAICLCESVHRAAD